MATLATGYGPSRRLLFDGDEAKYELWEIKFLGFMKTVLKTARTKIAGMLLGNRSDSAHKYGRVVLRVLSTWCTLNRSHTMPMQVFEIVANESNEPNKASLN